MSLVPTKEQRLASAERSAKDAAELLEALRRDYAALRASNQRLEAEVERLKRDNEELLYRMGFACENPEPGCDCSGCSLARDESAAALSPATAKETTNG